MAMLQLLSLTKTFGPERPPVLERLDLSVEEGEFVFLTGPSGAGKTTLLHLILGADFPTAGGILVAGRDPGRLNGRQLAVLRRHIGMVFQDFRLLPRRSVFENVALSLRVAGMKPRQVVARVEEMLEAMELTRQAASQAASLSGGEQQRVAIARALVGRPKLILADEPTGNLDPDNTQRVMDLLQKAHGDGGTVLVATHDPSLLRRTPGARVVHLPGAQQPLEVQL